MISNVRIIYTIVRASLGLSTDEYGRSLTTLHPDTEKAQTHVLDPYLEAVGIARIMEISSEPALSREQKAASLPLYCIL